MTTGRCSVCAVVHVRVQAVRPERGSAAGSTGSVLCGGQELTGSGFDGPFTPLDRLAMELFRTIAPNSASISRMAIEQGFMGAWAKAIA